MKKQLFFLLYFTSITLLVAQQSYYNDVDLTKTGMALKNELAIKITNTHTKTLSYSQAREALKVTDLEPNQTTNVLLIYGFSNDNCQTNTSNDNDHRLRNKSSFGGGASCEWNREHTFPKSLGNPNLGTSGPGADAHHLRASDVQRNSARGSKKFANGSGNSGSSNGGWYPGDEWKGDVARMMMYMYLRYGNQCKPTQVGNGSSSGTPDAMIDLFLKWNAEDPVSQYEDNRNDYLENTGNSYGQGNRNPFIDNPNLATQIWGGPVAQNRWGGNSSDTQAPTTPTNLSASNETSNSVELSWNASSDNIAVTAYQIFIDGNLNATTSNTTAVITNLNASTTYNFSVLAKDASGNKSAQSSPIQATTTASNDGGNGGNPSNCVNETFENIQGSSSYKTISWTGDNNFQWTATKARADQRIDNKAITLGKGSTAKITTATVSGGISKFTVTTKRFFSGGSGTYDLLVNGNKVGTINYGTTEETTVIDNINIAGNVLISIENNSGSGNRVGFDNLSWECYSTANTDKYSKLNTISLYPIPSTNGSVTLSVPNDVEVNSIKIFSILGKKVYQKENVSSHTIRINNLESGVYLLKASNNNSSITKKIIIQ